MSGEGILSHDALSLDALEWAACSVGLQQPVEAEMIGGGRSNLTFCITDAGGRRVVLRRPPLGPLLPRAHDLGREFQILSCLVKTDVPVPEPLSMCADPDVLGVPFYVMSLVEGTVIKDTAAAGLFDIDSRHSLSLDMVRVLAALHRLDPAQVGLSDLGRSDGYPQRILARWMRQLDTSAADPPRDLVRLHTDLLRRAPRSYQAGIVHGDYRLENCVADLAAGGRVSAVLDWELCTLGDTTADIGYWLMYWGEPINDIAAVAFPNLPSRLPGFPSRQDLLRHYELATRRDVSDVPYYWALAHWKLACILHGAHQRYASGSMMGSVEETEIIARRSEAIVALAGFSFESMCAGELP